MHPGRHLFVLLGIALCLACSGQQSIRQDLPSEQEAWVNSACTPVSPDFSAWTRRQVGSVTIAIPPGYIAEQGPPTNIGIRGPARRSTIVVAIHNQQEAQRSFDASYDRQRQYRHVCRTTLSGYTADVIGGYDRGQYFLVARWQVEWKGGDEGKSLVASISGTRLEEVIELRAVIHTIRPVESND